MPTRKPTKSKKPAARSRTKARPPVRKARPPQAPRTPPSVKRAKPAPQRPKPAPQRPKPAPQRPKPAPQRAVAQRREAPVKRAQGPKGAVGAEDVLEAKGLQLDEAQAVELEPEELDAEELETAGLDLAGDDIATIKDEEDLLADESFDGQQQDEAEPEAPDRLERDPAARPPVVAIVGRPNVGKSTLLNALSGSRISIVEATPGVTRDRVGVLCTLADRTVELVDTGGVGIVDNQGLASYVEEQVRVAVDAAAVILFVLDAREGLAPLDERVAGMLRRAASRVIPVANKAETERVTWNVGEIEGLGFGSPLVISAQEHIGLEALEDAIGERLPAGPTTPRRLPPPEMKLAIVGRVNAGKSSLVNSLLHQQRMIVSAVPGTTRDTVDVRFERDGKAFVVIDTAGIRKERAVQGGVEFYAQRRAERAMRRADVSAIVLDATADVSRLDRSIAGYALDHHHPVLIVVNKWDLRPPELTTSQYAKYVRITLRGLTYAPIVFTTATDGRNVDAVIDVARGLFRQAATRIKTAQLNKSIEQAQQKRHPRPYHGRVGQIYYGTQVEERPPTFVLFVNDPTLFDSTYRRYLENQFRATLPIPEVPLRVFFKARDRRPSKNALGPLPE